MSSFTDEPTFDPGAGVYRLHTDWHTIEDPGILVAEAVAAILNRDVLDLSPLQDVVDLDSLQELMHAPVKNPLSVEFEYENTLVDLSRAGEIVIEVL